MLLLKPDDLWSGIVRCFSGSRKIRCRDLFGVLVEAGRFVVQICSVFGVLVEAGRFAVEICSGFDVRGFGGSRTITCFDLFGIRCSVF